MVIPLPTPDQMEQSIGGHIESYEFDKGNNTLMLKVRSLTTEFLEKDLIKKYYKSLIGKEIRWRHVQPELFTGSFLGETLETWIDEKTGDLMSKILIHGDTKEQKKAQKWIFEQLNHKDKKKRKVGISVGFIRILDNKEKTTKVFFREQSVTPFPHCTDCGVVEIMTNEDPNPKDITPEGQISGSSPGVMVTAPDDFEGKITIDTHQKDEDKEKNKDNDEEEDKDEDDEEDEKKKEKAKNEEKEKQKLKQLKELESKNSELETKLKESQESNTKLNDRIIELEVEKEIMLSAPKRKRIAELEGLSDPTQLQKRMNELLQLEDKAENDQKSQLDMMLESLERAIKHTKSSSEVSDRSSSTPVVGSIPPPGYRGKEISAEELEKMTPDEVLKAAKY